MKTNLFKWAAALSVVTGLIALASCGGGGGNSSTSRGVGRMTVSVKWPPKSRFIPPASMSIRAVVTSGTTVLATYFFIAQNGLPSTPEVHTFDNLPVGTVTLTATAYPNTDSTGVAQATGATPATITAGQNTAVTLTMASTITHIDITPASPSVNAGSTVQLTATAKDSSNAVVLTHGTFSWTSGTTSVATVPNVSAAQINATGVSAGTSLITATLSATEAGSAISGTTTLTVASLGSGCAPPTGTGGPAATAWPKFGRDARNTSLSNNPAAAGSTNWTKSIGGGTSIPVLAQTGLLIFGTSSDNSVYALNQGDGSQAWKFQADAPVESIGAVDRTTSFVYIASHTTLYAIDTNTGVQAWSVPMSYALSPNIGLDGTVYVEESFNESAPAKLHALNGATGAQKWAFTQEFPGSNFVGGSPAISPTDGTIYFTGSDGNIYAVDPCGNKKWSFVTGTSGQRTSSPTLGTTQDNALYIHSSVAMTKLNATTGSEIWTVTSGVGFSAPAIGTNGSIFVTDTGSVKALNPSTGATLWTYTPSLATGATETEAIAVASDNTVYVTESNGLAASVVALNGATGAKKWEVPVNSADFGLFRAASPMIDGNGNVVVHTFAGNIYSIK